MFGAIARGDAGPASNVDLLVEVDHSAALGLFDPVNLKDALATKLGRPLGIANPGAFGRRPVAWAEVC